MKTFLSFLLLAGATALAAPAHAQQTPIRSTTTSEVQGVTDQQTARAQPATAKTADNKLTWQQRRAIKRKKLTPYAEAMLHNELLREEPAKKTGAGLL